MAGYTENIKDKLHKWQEAFNHANTKDRITIKKVIKDLEEIKTELEQLDLLDEKGNIIGHI